MSSITPPQFAFSNLFANLPSQFHTKLQPTPLPNPYVVGISTSAAQLLDLNINDIGNEDHVALFTGNVTASSSEPLAAVYSGHQFGHWAGQLGDGRAILLGDLADKNEARGWEVQLKGAGMTPYSRMGDGRAVLRSSIREFLCSEAMAHLGIPTSRALCVTGSDQLVWRETPETTAVVTRLAPTFIRFGSFQHWYYKGDAESLQTLADFVLRHYLPELLSADNLSTYNPYQALLSEVTKRTAELMAHWQAVGFMHGVMNTDNMSILGITLDYGPYGFMEAFDPNHICNHTDQQGRYAYNMQPQIGQWNCHALGQAMLPLIGNVKDTEAALAIYPSAYEQKWSQLVHQKFGLETMQEDDEKIVDSFFDLMQAHHADFTLSFRTLSKISKHSASQDEALRDLFIDRPALDTWLSRYRTRLQAETATDDQRKVAMNAINPKYILRNYLAQTAIEKAQKKDFTEVAKLLHILERPFDEQPENEIYAALPPDWAHELEVSCSS